MGRVSNYRCGFCWKFTVPTDGSKPPYCPWRDSKERCQKTKTGVKPDYLKDFEPLADVVNQPNHYTAGGIETIDFIEAKGLGFHLGNAIKYISRAGRKGDFEEDIRKAIWYLERELRRRADG